MFEFSEHLEDPLAEQMLRGVVTAMGISGIDTGAVLDRGQRRRVRRLLKLKGLLPG